MQHSSATPPELSAFIGNTNLTAQNHTVKVSKNLFTRFLLDTRSFILRLFDRLIVLLSSPVLSIDSGQSILKSFRDTYVVRTNTTGFLFPAFKLINAVSTR